MLYLYDNILSQMLLNSEFNDFLNFFNEILIIYEDLTSILLNFLIQRCIFLSDSVS